jgi:endonuclease G, mitochondrial
MECRTRAKNLGVLARTLTVIPNSAGAKRDRLDEFIVTIQELELVTGEAIPVDEYIKQEKPEHSWGIPRGCNKG